MPARISNGTIETPPPAPLALDLPNAASPLAAAVAAPTQSLRFSGGSIWSRRMLSTWVELPPAAAAGPGNAYERCPVATARIASSLLRSLTVRGLLRPADRALRGEGRRRPPTAGRAGRCKSWSTAFCRSPRLQVGEHPGVVGDLVGQPERRFGRRPGRPGGRPSGSRQAG